jgi:hypothetical protein
MLFEEVALQEADKAEFENRVQKVSLLSLPWSRVSLEYMHADDPHSNIAINSC